MRFYTGKKKFYDKNCLFDANFFEFEVFIKPFRIIFKLQKCANSIFYWPEDTLTEKSPDIARDFAEKVPPFYLFPSILGVRKDPVDIVFSDSDK
jgi:hypothetical protein